MTLAEWRTNKRRVKTARALLQAPIMVEMLQILAESGPLFYQARNLPYAAGSTPQDHSRMLGMCEGYALALDYLKSFGTMPPVPVTEIIPRFEPPERNTL